MLLGERDHADRAAQTAREAPRDRAVELISGFGVPGERVGQPRRPEDQEIDAFDRDRGSARWPAVDEQPVPDGLSGSEEDRQKIGGAFPLSGMTVTVRCG